MTWVGGSVKSETFHFILILHLHIFFEYCLCKKSCLSSDKGCRQIPWLGGKLIKWSGINQSLVLLTFPSKLPPSASRTTRARNRQTLWSTLASHHHQPPHLVVSQVQHYMATQKRKWRGCNISTISPCWKHCTTLSCKRLLRGPFLLPFPMRLYSCMAI